MTDTESHTEGRTISSEERLMEVVAAMQEKYTQNLSVIEKLFEERKQMERRVRSLENELAQSRRISHGGDSGSAAKNRLNKTAPGLAQGRGLDLDIDLDEDGSGRNKWEGRLAKTSMSVLDIPGAGDEALPQDRGSPPPPSYSSSPTRNTSRNYHSSTSDNLLVSARQAAEMFDDVTPPRSRPRSARSASTGRTSNQSGLSKSVTRSRSGSLGPPAHLQADTDKYLQKRKLIEERERQKALEQKQYELELEEKRLRASRRGKVFSAMEEREKRAREVRQAREKKKQQKQREREEVEMELAQKEKLRRDRLRRSADISKDWQTLQRDEENKRKDRIEARKMELAQTAKYPSSMGDSVKEWKMKKTTNVEGSQEAVAPPSEPVFRAQDPEEVTAKLRRKQAAWERRLEKEKAQLNASRSKTAPVKAALEMEERQRAYEEKRRLKAEEAARKKEAEDREAERKKRREQERIIKSKVPEASRRLTKAAEDRARAVRASFEKKAMEEKRQAQKKTKQERRMKETAEFLKSLVRKPEMTESEREEQAKIRAQESVEMFKMNRKRNQANIKNALSSRPSLLERHDQAIAKSKAGTAALGKVAAAVFQNSNPSDEDEGKYSDDDIDKKLNWKSKSATNDIFDEEEKIQLGLRDD